MRTLGIRIWDFGIWDPQVDAKSFQEQGNEPRACLIHEIILHIISSHNPERDAYTQWNPHFGKTYVAIVELEPPCLFIHFVPTSRGIA